MSRLQSILIAEDDIALRAVLARYLEALGYLVLQAGTFREAVDQMAIKPALMVLDITLPDATGWDVAQWLESMTEPVPIVLISGGTPETKRLQQFHPVAFLPKPFSVEDLLRVVEEHLPQPRRS
jgi:two-component system KDP operon response regulator KdpE